MSDPTPERADEIFNLLVDRGYDVCCVDIADEDNGYEMHFNGKTTSAYKSHGEPIFAATGVTDNHVLRLAEAFHAPKLTPPHPQAEEVTTRSKIVSLLNEMCLDELQVVLFVAQRIDGGRKVHGELKIDSDHDWPRERAEELADAMVYTACDELKRWARANPLKR